MLLGSVEGDGGHDYGIDYGILHSGRLRWFFGLVGLTSSTALSGFCMALWQKRKQVLLWGYNGWRHNIAHRTRLIIVRLLRRLAAEESEWF